MTRTSTQSAGSEPKINSQAVAAILRRAGHAQAERITAYSYPAWRGIGFTVENVGSDNGEWSRFMHRICVGYQARSTGRWYHPTEEQRAAHVAKRDEMLAAYAKTLAEAGYIVTRTTDRGVALEAWRPEGSHGAKVAVEHPEMVAARPEARP
jgi:hypothetical protein